MSSSRGCRVLVLLSTFFVLSMAQESRSQVYQCGDFNGDGVVSINDIVHLINYLFAGGILPVDVSNGDVNCDARTNITDGVFMVNYIFGGGSIPCTGCQTSVVFLSPILSNPGGTFANLPTLVTAKISIEPQIGLDPSTVYLYRINEFGAIIEPISMMFDNGDLDVGDEIEGDWVFTCRFTVDSPTPGVDRWQVRAVAVVPGGNLESSSQIYFFQIAEEYTEEQYTQQLDGRNEADSIYQANIAAGDLVAKQAAVSYLRTRDEVTDAGITPDQQIIWILYADGSQAGIYAPTADVAVYGSGRTPHRPDLPLRVSPLVVNTTPFAQSQSFGSIGSLRQPSDDVIVSSSAALILSPFHTWISSIGQVDPCPMVATGMMNNECPQFAVTYLEDGAAGVEAFRTLETYGTICIVTHGGLWNDGRVVILTGEQSSFWSDLAYFTDLHSWGPNRLIKIRHDGVDYYSITPTFVQYYSETDFPNSIVYMCACEGMKNNTMADALLSEGAGIVLGYDESVSVSFANGVTVDYFDELVTNDVSAIAAYNSISPSTDPYHLGANFVYRTNASDVVYEDDLFNGGFELGALTGWSPQGDGRVISGLGDDPPREGAYMGIISTGLGFTTATGSISQSFCLPAGATTLKFAYNFYSEEFLEWCGSIFQDYFRVTITPEGGAPTVLIYQHVDDLCAMVVPAPISFDMGGVYRTGWLFPEFDISAFAGQAVTIEFAAGDIGDSIYDTAILIDMVSFE